MATAAPVSRRGPTRPLGFEVLRFGFIGLFVLFVLARSVRIVNEFERGFLEDFAVMLRRLVPTEHYYAHDDWDRRTENICEEDMEFGNGHAHCMSMMLGSAGESIPVADNELQLGTWQRVLFIELDRERDRRWIAKVVGS